MIKVKGKLLTPQAALARLEELEDSLEDDKGEIDDLQGNIWRVENEMYEKKAERSEILSQISGSDLSKALPTLLQYRKYKLSTVMVPHEGWMCPDFWGEKRQITFPMTILEDMNGWVVKEWTGFPSLTDLLEVVPFLEAR